MKVEWHKAEPVTVGKSKLPLDGEFTYTSKCGRFQIRKKQYTLPVRSVGYTLVYLETGRQNASFDLLADAKAAAEDSLDLG